MNGNEFFDRISKLVRDAIDQGIAEKENTRSTIGRVALFDQANELAEMFDTVRKQEDYWREMCVEAQIKEHEALDKIAALEADLKELHQISDEMECVMESKISAQEIISALEQLDR